MAATSSLYGGGGGIKSIQRGSTAVGISLSGYSTTATINAVDLAKSFISATTKFGYYVTYYASYAYNLPNTTIGVGATLSNTTTVTFASNPFYQSSVWAGSNPTIYWEVIEYE